MIVANDSSSEDGVALGRRMATRACELSEWKNADILDTLAYACMRQSDYREAVRVQRLAVENAKSDEEKDFYRNRLGEMEEKLAEQRLPGAR